MSRRHNEAAQPKGKGNLSMRLAVALFSMTALVSTIGFNFSDRSHSRHATAAATVAGIRDHLAAVTASAGGKLEGGQSGNRTIASKGLGQQEFDAGWHGHKKIISSSSSGGGGGVEEKFGGDETAMTIYHQILCYDSFKAIFMCGVESLGLSVSRNDSVLWLWVRSDLQQERLKERVDHLVDSTSGPRVVYKRLNFEDLFAATPMETFWDLGLLNTGGKLDEERYGKHGWQAVYDAARLAIVHKYGGFYMDADHVVIKDPRHLSFGFAQYSRLAGANNAFYFPRNHGFVEDLMRGFVRNYTKDDWSQGPKSFKRTWEEGGWAARCVEGGGKGEGKGEEIGGGGREGREGGGGGGRESRFGGEKAGCEPKLVAWAPYAVHPIKAKIYFQVAMERGSKSRQSGEQKVAQYATMVHSYSHVADEPEMALLKQCMSEAGQDIPKAVSLFREALIGDLRFKYCPRTLRDMACETEGKPPCPSESFDDAGGLGASGTNA